MGIFSKESPFDQDIEKATSETNTKEDWALILDICDRVCTSPQAPKECLRAIIKRLNHQDPHVAIQAATLLDACVSNCKQSFHLEVASRDFEQEYCKILKKTTEKTLRDKLLGILEKWATTEFRDDPQLDLIPSLYNKLKASGTLFPNSESPSKGKKGASAHHHSHKAKSHSGGGASSTASAATQEEADLAKAIELSLKETQNSPKTRSLYPQGLGQNGTSSQRNASPVPEPRKVRALYDFEAAEDNELTFYAGEIVHVLDDSDANWWQGSNQRGNGLFPSNFVTADLSAEAPKLDVGGRKSVQFNDEVEVKTVEAEPEVVEIDKAKIEAALHMLHEADPTTNANDPPELAVLEEQVNQMGPLIDAELEKIDRRHAQLTRLGSELVDALNMYHHLMKDPNLPPGSAMPYTPRMPPGMQGPPLSGPPSYQPMSSNMASNPWNSQQAPAPYYSHAPVPGGHPYSVQSMPPGMIMTGPPPGMQNGFPPHHVTSPTHIPQVNSAPPNIPTSGPPHQVQAQMGQGHHMGLMSPPPQQHQQQQPPQMTGVFPTYSHP